MKLTIEQILNKAISDCKDEGGDVYNLFEAFMTDIAKSQSSYKAELDESRLQETASTEMQVAGVAYLFMLEVLEQTVIDYAEKETKDSQTVSDLYDAPLAEVMANLNALCADDETTTEQLELIIEASQLIQANYCRDDETMQEAVTELETEDINK